MKKERALEEAIRCLNHNRELQRGGYSWHEEYLALCLYRGGRNQPV
jgi:hypothetical protein